MKIIKLRYSVAIYPWNSALYAKHETALATIEWFLFGVKGE